jgi:hypothetical protein
MGTGQEKPVDGGASVKPCECGGGTVTGFVKASPKGGLRHVFQLISGLALALCGHQVAVERTFDDDKQPPCLACFHVLSMLTTTQNGAPVNRWSGGGPV